MSRPSKSLPGPEPLYLALASGGAMIWDIVGATERIAGVVADADVTIDKSGDARLQRFAAINGRLRDATASRWSVSAGVAREKVHFTAHTGCPGAGDSGDDEATAGAEEIATLLLGRSGGRGRR